MHTLPNATEHPSPIPKRTKRTAYQRMGNGPLFDLRSELYRIAGVDLTDIPGVSAIAAQVVLTEVGPDVSRFRNASAFASWLGLCPDKRISGGKVLSTKTRKVKNRVAIVLRLGAKSLSRAQDYFGAFFRRMRARLGTAQAITATAHKLARVVYHVLHSKEPYTERQSSTAAMNKNSSEPKCASANTPHYSASNSYPPGIEGRSFEEFVRIEFFERGCVYQARLHVAGNGNNRSPFLACIHQPIEQMDDTGASGSTHCDWVAG